MGRVEIRALVESDAAAWWRIRLESLEKEPLRDTGLKERHKGRIYGVYVTATQRGKGVGRALIATLLEKAKQNSSLEQIMPAVTTSQNAARQLYRDFGFETYGREPNALKVGATYIDEDHMVLCIR